MNSAPRAVLDHYLLPSAYGCSGKLIAERLLVVDAEKQMRNKGS